MLGCLWEKEDLLKADVRPDGDTKQLAIPLATLLHPELVKSLREMLSKAKDKHGNAIKELGALPLKDFLEFYKKSTAGVKM